MARLVELTAHELHGILELRQGVFVVEQRCAYADIDSRDVEPLTRHCWIVDGGTVVSALRLLDEGGGVHRIGRVATAPAHRGRGLAAALVRRAIQLAGPPIVIGAQAHLATWYATFGFVERGDRWVEDGIEHAPMRLDTADPST